MPTSTTAWALAAIAGLSAANPLLGARAKCNADNCARLITGTRAGLPTGRIADCSSFQLATVIPPTVTSTVTAISFESTVSYPFTTVPIYDDITVSTTTFAPYTTATLVRSPYSNPNATAVAKRVVTSVDTGTTIKPTAVPAYATAACSPYQRYASACSCAGVTTSTTTLDAPVTFVTVQEATTITENYVLTTSTTVTRDVVETILIPATTTATGLPCNATITPPYGARDTYKVMCGVYLYRSNRYLTSYYGLSEGECLDKCAQTSNCNLAEWTYPDRPLCELFSGDPANPGAYPGSGSDGLIQIARGNGTVPRPTS